MFIKKYGEGQNQMVMIEPPKIISYPQIIKAEEKMKEPKQIESVKKEKKSTPKKSYQKMEKSMAEEVFFFLKNYRN